MVTMGNMGGIMITGMEMVIMEKAMVLEDHLLVPLFLLIIQLYVFLQGFFGVNLMSMISTKDHK